MQVLKLTVILIGSASEHSPSAKDQKKERNTFDNRVWRSLVICLTVYVQQMLQSCTFMENTFYPNCVQRRHRKLLKLKMFAGCSICSAQKMLTSVTKFDRNYPIGGKERTQRNKFWPTPNLFITSIREHYKVIETIHFKTSVKLIKPVEKLTRCVFN